MDIPVTGDLSDPKTKIGSIVWDATTNFLAKIASAPFTSLGKMFGVDAKDLEEINFNYGDTILMQKQIKSLDLLLEVEAEKPELQIDLQYLNDKKLERMDVSKEISHQFFYNDMGKKAATNRKEYIAYLEEKTGQDSLVIQDYEMLLAPETMVDSIVEQNEIIRLRNVREYLSDKNDSTSIRIFDYNPEEVLNIGSRPKFTIRYLLAEDEE
jgi:hypothetical protein